MTPAHRGTAARGRPVEIEPVEDDLIRAISPMTLFGAWLDVCIVRDAGDRITDLQVDGGRARNRLFARKH
jgi:hypothetical protein